RCRRPRGHARASTARRPPLCSPGRGGRGSCTRGGRCPLPVQRCGRPRAGARGDASSCRRGRRRSGSGTLGRSPSPAWLPTGAVARCLAVLVAAHLVPSPALYVHVCDVRDVEYVEFFAGVACDALFPGGGSREREGPRPPEANGRL